MTTIHSLLPFPIPPSEGVLKGERLDRWLAQQVPALSRSRAQQLIQEGQVWVNGVVCSEKKYCLQAGDRVEVSIPAATPVDLQPQAIPLDILYEDEDVIVINKAKGMVVHPAPGHTEGTLVHALLAHCPSLQGIGGEQRPGIVHRLDKNTTGVMVIAKSEMALQHLQAQIQAKTAQREYVGVVLGRPGTDTGSIEAPVGRHPSDRKKMAVVKPPRGRWARTHWRVMEHLGNFTLVHFLLDTGRTHQIRVHCAHMGWPIVGDPEYTSSKRTPVKLTGQALHAWRLTFQHPRHHEQIECVAPYPLEMDRLLQRLRQIYGA
jgi:23S rRNA pseudouridine1911/1915/1917 synthase